MKGYKRCVLAFMALIGLVMLAQIVVTASRADDCKYTYESFGKAFMEKYCNGCHSSTKTGISRKGAPADYDFDKPELIAKEKKDIIEWTVEKKKMPPLLSTKPSDEERAQVKTWLDCEYNK
ncbi:MAG TPA: hypothetical protein PKW95_14850 [bacterium]|nr:hypothetical protein [bacterium]